MKIVPGHVNRTVITRVIVAWAALSLLAGAVGFYVELERVNRSVFKLAINESKRYTEHIDAVGPEMQNCDKGCVRCFPGPSKWKPPTEGPPPSPFSATISRGRDPCATFR